MVAEMFFSLRADRNAEVMRGLVDINGEKPEHDEVPSAIKEKKGKSNLETF